MSKINEAIVNVYKEVGYVQKDGKIAFGNTKYNFAGEAAFIRAIRPAMVDNNLFMSPSKYEILSTVNGLVTVYAEFTLTHKDGETIVVTSIGQGKDSGDKAIPKALTGALKYALRQLFLIETGDDPDNLASEAHDTIDKLHKFLNNCDSLEKFNKRAAEGRKAIDSLQKVSSKDYHELNKKFNIKRKELSSNDTDSE